MGGPREGRSFSLRWKVNSQHGLTTVALAGELDIASVDSLQNLADELLDETPVLVFDLQDLGFIDSTGLRLFGMIHRTAQGAGKRFLLGRISPATRRLLHVSGLVNFFEYVEGTPSAEKLCHVCDSWTPAGELRCMHCGAGL